LNFKNEKIHRKKKAKLGMGITAQGHLFAILK